MVQKGFRAALEDGLEGARADTRQVVAAAIHWLLHRVAAFGLGAAEVLATKTNGLTIPIMGEEVVHPPVLMEAHRTWELEEVEAPR